MVHPYILVMLRDSFWTYLGRWIDRGSSRSPDLDSLDFSLWSHLKTIVYSVPTDNKQQLLQRIEDECLNSGSE